MGVLSDVVIAKPDQAREICDLNSRKKFTKEYIGKSVPIDWFIALLCVLDNRRFSTDMGSEFPILVDEDLRATKISDELINLISKIDEDCIPDIAEDWRAWMDAHGDKVVGANETPANRRRVRTFHKETKFMFKAKSKKEKAEWDKETRESLQILLHKLKELSKKAIRRKKTLFLRHCP